MEEFEFSILQNNTWTLKKSFAKIAYLFFKKSGLSFFFKFVTTKKNLFTVIMNIGNLELYTFPWFQFKAASKSIYLFDAWEQYYETIIAKIKKYNINYLFVSSSFSAERLENKISGCFVQWIPEGINSEDYKFQKFEAKDIDILQMGRKYSLYHNKILKFCESENISYVYEKKKGEIIYKTRNEFIEGLSRTKISICVPASVTDPNKKNVSTLTQRYLQSMSSKALILGMFPQEMIDLFGYLPGVEIDMNDSVKQLQYILKNYKNYIPLIEKNFEQVLKAHQWKNRFNEIQDIWENNKNLRSSY
ncbi:MAG: hypothetical protein K1X86_07610 [Ignavibacteria bacterium]|nr:hypothetical protein [Ignavibacteria bacterium]